MDGMSQRGPSTIGPGRARELPPRPMTAIATGQRASV